jgi:transglutaminase-like putative cysteine protease
VVNGLVYCGAYGGFLYHSWNETYINGQWLVVDPTFGQVPADATHIKLLEGSETADLLPMLDIIGKIRIRIMDFE